MKKKSSSIKIHKNSYSPIRIFIICSKNIINKAVFIINKIEVVIKLKKITLYLLIIIPVTIFTGYFIGDCGYVLINTSLELQDVIEIITCLATIFLGLIAYEQNSTLEKVNRELMSKGYAAENYSKITAISFEVYYNDSISLNKSSRHELLYWDRIETLSNSDYSHIINLHIGFKTTEYIKYINYTDARIYTKYGNSGGIIVRDGNFKNDIGYCNCLVFNGEVSNKNIRNESERKEFQISIAVENIEDKLIHAFINDGAKIFPQSEQCNKIKEILLNSKKNRFEIEVNITNSFNVITMGFFFFEFQQTIDNIKLLEKGFITTGFKMEENYERSNNLTNNQPMKTKV